MAQGIFLHEYNTGGKLYDGSVSDAANRLANRQYVADNAALQSNNLSDLDNAATARTNLGVAIGSDVQAYSARLAELSSLSQADGSFVVSDGSSFVFESGSTARSSLGLGSIATQDASSVSITGGSVAGITDLAIADGGTGASSAADARSNLGLAIGSDVQAYDSELAALASVTSAANKIPMFSGSGTATLVDFLDEDGMASDSATAVPSQQSVKAFVQAQVQGLDVKNSVRVATTADLSMTYSSSAKTLTAGSTGVLTIDGGNIAQGDRVLVKDQSTGTENGIYECTTAGAAGGVSGPDDNTEASGTADSWDTANSFTLNVSTLASTTINTGTSTIYFSESGTNYAGSTVEVPAGAALLLSDGTNTLALRNRTARYLTNGATNQQFRTAYGFSYIASLSNVTSIAGSDVTSATIYPVDQQGLLSRLAQSSVSNITTSITMSPSWDGSTISSGFYLRYEPVSNQVYYWEVTADVESGDSSISVSYDSSESYANSVASFDIGSNRATQTQFSLIAAGSGANAATAVLTRAADFDEDSEVTAGAFTFVEEGTVNDNAGFVLSTDEPFAIDTDSITFTQFSGAGQITAGTGLSKSGNTINASGTLADVAGLSTTDGGIIVGDGSNFVLESGATARTSLGVAIGSDVLAYDAAVQSIADASISSDAFLVGNSSGNLEPKTGADARNAMSAQQSNARLDDISGLAVTDGGIIVGDGSNFVLESGATARASLDAQQQSDILDDIAGVTQAADKGVYFDSSSTAATFDLTSAGRALLDDADAAAQRSTLGLGSIATQASSSVSISGGSISGITDLAVADGGTGASNAADARANLSAQESNARLDDIAGLTPSDSGFIVGDGSNFVVESAATARASLGVDVAGTDNSTDVTLASVSGNYLSLSGQEITASTVPVSLGGTGATTVAAAQQALDLEPSVDIMAYDAELAALAGLTSAANKIPMFSGSGSATLVDFLDEDGMDSDSATGIPSQQSVKAFVQAQVQGLDVKKSVRVATTANLSATYSSSAKTLTMSSTGVLNIDGGNIAQGDRILVKDQSTGTQNGVYECTTAGAAGGVSGPDDNTAASGTADVWDTANSYTLNVDTLQSGTISYTSSTISMSGSGGDTYGGSTVTVAGNSALLFSDGTNTLALRTYDSNRTLSNGGNNQYLTPHYRFSYIEELSNVTSIQGSDVTSITVYPVTTEGLMSRMAGTMYTTSTSINISPSWDGSTISSGFYFRYEPVSGQAYYWEVTDDVESGDSTMAVSFDSSNSYSSTILGFSMAPARADQLKYSFVAAGTGGTAAAAVLTRASDFDEDSEVTAGAFTFVEEGTVNDNAGFVLSTDEPFAIDTDSITFTQFSGAGQITAGTGLSKSGNTISASGTLADIAGLAVTDGGIIVGDGSNFVLETGSTARASLDAQQSNARLDDISALAVTDGGIIVGDGSNFVLESGATARASLDAQQRNDILDDLAGLTQAADKGMYFDSSSTAATFDLTAAGRALLDDADASAQRSTLGLGSIATQASSSVSISGGSISGITDLAVADGGTGASSASDARTNLGVAIGSDVQSHSDILDDIAGVTQAADKAVYFDSSSTAATFDLTSAARALLDDADAAAMRATLGLVIGTDVAAADSSEMAVDTSEPSSLAIGDVSGMYVYDLSSASTSATVSLPSTATSGAAGKSVIFKIKSTVGSGSSLTISPASNQTIEGESSIVLNQERQSIRLVISEEYSSGSSVQCWVAV